VKLSNFKELYLGQFLSDLDNPCAQLIRITYVILSPLLGNGAQSRSLIESCLPLIPLLVSQRQRLATLRTVCSPPSVNPATAHLHPAFHSLSSYRAPDDSRAHTKGLLLVYLLLIGKTPARLPCPSPPHPHHLPIDTVAHTTIAFTGGLSRVPMINAHLVP